MGFNSGLKGLMEIAFSQHIFEEFSNIKFHEKLSSGGGGEELFHADGQTDR